MRLLFDHLHIQFADCYIQQIAVLKIGSSSLATVDGRHLNLPVLANLVLVFAYYSNAIQIYSSVLLPYIYRSRRFVKCDKQEYALS